MNLPVSLEAENSSPTEASPYSPTPTVDIRDASPELAALPREGTITFRFRRDEAKVSEHNGHQHLDLKLSLLEVLDVVGQESEGPEDASKPEDIIDTLFHEAVESEADEKEED